MKKCKIYNLGKYIVLVYVDDYNKTQAIYSDIIITDNMINNIEFFSSNQCKNYLNYVNHKRLEVDRSYSKITEKYIRELLKELK